jgi:GT2 family glycosyltransferase
VSSPQITVVVVPRERFGVTRRALEAVYATTRKPFHLIYVDGGSPAKIRRYLADEARARGFQLIRTDRYLTPNQARNLALPHVTTPYVAFIDNDVIPERGWLEALRRCMDETGAWIVGPLYCEGEPDAAVIHMAGGEAHFEESAGRRRFFERHRLAGHSIAEAHEVARREECELVEFHCMLVRRDVFDRLGPLDEGLMALAEHVDLCLLVRQHGGRVYYEPQAVVTYVFTGRFGLTDMHFYQHRWSEAWTAATIDRFAAKWDVDPSDPSVTAFLQFARNQRHMLLDPLRRPLLRVLGTRRSRWLRRTVLPSIENRLNRWWVRLDRPAPAHESRIARGKGSSSPGVGR